MDVNSTFMNKFKWMINVNRFNVFKKVPNNAANDVY